MELYFILKAGGEKAREKILRRGMNARRGGSSNTPMLSGLTKADFFVNHNKS